MTHIIAVDPGNTESAFVRINATTCQPISAGKHPNATIRGILDVFGDELIAVEMVASYGMPVGAEVFETCVAIGRYIQIAPHAQLVYRRDVKLHLCGTARASDANITQALVDRFAPGQANRGKGTKGKPGFFHGFKADVWQAMALAVYVADTYRQETRNA